MMMPLLYQILSCLFLVVFLGFDGGCVAFSMTRTRPMPSSGSTLASSSIMNPTTTTTITNWCLIDVENVRGKNNFQEGHEDLMTRIHQHHSHNNANMNSTIILVMDHGTDLTVQTILSNNSNNQNRMVLVFAGPHQKADQVLIDLCRSIDDNATEVKVVSSDREVVEGCRQAHRATTILEPVKFLELLPEEVPMDNNEFAALLNNNNNAGITQNNNHQNNNNKSLTENQALQNEVAAKQEVQLLSRLLNPKGKGKKKLSRKQRTKLNSRRMKAQERLNRLLVANGGSVMDFVLSNTDDNAIFNTEVLDASAVQIRRGVSETTYERQLLAERLRRRLQTARPGVITNTVDNNEEMWSQIWNQLTIAPTELNNEERTHRYRLGQPFPYNPDTLNCLSDSMEQILTVRTNYQHLRCRQDNNDNQEQPKSLRLLVMSDTHGMEGQLFTYIGGTTSGTATAQQQTYNILPPADVLIHCGDFYGQRSKLKQLDQFFAAQTHIPTKIIVRGNHDPKSPSSVLFPKSKAMFVTKPSMLCLNNDVVVALRPHSRQYDPNSLLPPQCDILITHEPPFGILDYCYSGQRAGSTVLRHIVEQSEHKPALWLCGHIHEGRGVTSHSFVPSNIAGVNYLNHSKHNKKKKNSKLLLSQRERRAILMESSLNATTIEGEQSTILVNAASANEGKARSLVNGPVLIDFLLTNNNDKTPTTISATNHLEQQQQQQPSWTPINNTQPRKESSPQFLLRHDSLEAMKLADDAAGDENKKNNCLLSVDLGLRTGIAIFNATGFVMEVQSLRFDNHSHLSDWIHNTLFLQQKKNQNKITHVVLEGQDPQMVNLWRKALPEGMPLARVVAEEWRRVLLSRKEQRDSRKAKQAASLIAQQILHEKSATTAMNNNKLSPDAAEAILLGHYAVGVLKWTDLTASNAPAVQRYTNGDVVVPKRLGRKQITTVQ